MEKIHQPRVAVYVNFSPYASVEQIEAGLASWRKHFGPRRPPQPRCEKCGQFVTVAMAPLCASCFSHEQYEEREVGGGLRGLGA